MIDVGKGGSGGDEQKKVCRRRNSTSKVKLNIESP